MRVNSMWVLGAAVVAVTGAVSFGLHSRSPVLADAVRCDLSQYKSMTGLTAAIDQDLLVVTWAGQGGTEVRARYGIDGGKPVVRDLAVRKSGGEWGVLGQNLSPEFRVVSGIRRLSTQQAQPLRAAGVTLTPEVIEKNRWYAFWDAPLVLPDGPEMRENRAQSAPRAAVDPAAAARGRGTGPAARGPVGRGFANGQARGRGPATTFDPGGGLPSLPLAGRNIGEPRSEKDIKRASATFNTSSCSVKTDGQSLEVTFPGLAMGIFNGDLRFTVYKGTNLLRMEALASTKEQWIAYKYDAGLKGFTTDTLSRLTWHDTGGERQVQQPGRRGESDRRDGEGAQPRAGGGRQVWRDRDVHAAPHLLLHA